MPAVIKGSAQLCRMRVTRLDSTCSFVTGASGAVVTNAMMRIAASPEYEAGDDFRQKNGCSEILVAYKTGDSLVRVNLSLDLATRDPALIELMTGATVYTSGSPVEQMGFSRRGVGASLPPSCCVEIWTKAVGVASVCSTPAATSASDAAWWRIIWPKATFMLGDSTYANEVATVTMTGFAEPNPKIGDGPFNDIPVALTLDPTSPEHHFLDEVAPPAVVSGYVTVPT